MRLEQHAACAGVGRSGAVGFAGAGAANLQDANVGDIADSAAPRLLLLDFGVCFANHAVGADVHRAVGMELVADGTFGAEGEHGGTFVAQAIRVLEAAEFAPIAVELAGHA